MLSPWLLTEGWDISFWPLLWWSFLCTGSQRRCTRDQVVP